MSPYEQRDYNDCEDEGSDVRGTIETSQELVSRLITMIIVDAAAPTTMIIMVTTIIAATTMMMMMMVVVVVVVVVVVARVSGPVTRYLSSPY